MSKISKKFDKLSVDSTSGSTDILINLHNHIKKQQKSIQIFPEIIDIAKNQFKTFQNIQSYLNEMKQTLQKQKNLNSFFKQYDKILNDTFFSIYHNCTGDFKNISSFITISNSRTVFEVLKLLRNDKPKLKVFVCESRPKYEGRILVKKLLDKKIDTTIISESMISTTIPKCDCAMIGTDIVLKNGDVVNKVGSSALAILCKHYNKPFFVVSSKKKLSNSNSFTQKEMPPEEIWRHHPKNVKIKNHYFEKIDKELISKIIFD